MGKDGTLTMPSAEEKHSGTYKLVAQNSAGRKERQVKLHVKTGDEEEAAVPMLKKGPILVAKFGNHVEQFHSKNNQAFRTEYEVSPSLL